MIIMFIKSKSSNLNWKKMNNYMIKIIIISHYCFIFSPYNSDY